MKEIDAVNLRATIAGVEYVWGGSFGAVLISYENGVKRNDVRIIGREIFYAYWVSNSGWHREVNWVPKDDVSMEWIREFKRAMFGTA